MKPDKIWAHCPGCRHTQRFSRVETNHWLHLTLTICTLGLWGISWIALTIGRNVWPWRCHQCGWNAPDFSRSSKRSGISPKPPSDKPTAA